MRIDLLTLFPSICLGPLNESILKRAQESGVVQIYAHNIRDWATGKHRITDEPPYGGGQGMVMKVEPIVTAVEQLKTEGCRVIVMTPQGRMFKQAIAQSYSEEKHLILVCGHYEGIDHRAIELLQADELSIGDYVLTNGALAAAVVVDAVARLLPGALGDSASAVEETFSDGLLEGPHYTRPAEFRGLKIPDVLLSGNHAQIAKWRTEQGKARTRQNRPDLWEKWEGK